MDAYGSEYSAGSSSDSASPDRKNDDYLTDDEWTRPPSLPRSVNAGKIAKKGRSAVKGKSSSSKKKSSSMILEWLEENYTMIPGSCLARSVIYTHYQDFCKKNHLVPHSAASFGKVMRVKFPKLSTRRLGTRGQSKYHYYGLAIRETSIYFKSSYSKKGITRFSNPQTKRETCVYSSGKSTVHLPEFPQVKELTFSKDFPVDTLETFVIMYRAHCQRILDSVVRTNFEEVEEFLIHFWQGMPKHIFPILGCQVTLDLIVFCDFLLYKAISEAVVPSSLQPSTGNSAEEVVSFTKSVVEWLFSALDNLPTTLSIIKVQTAEIFGKTLRQQLVLVDLAKGARMALSSGEVVASMLRYLRLVEISHVIDHVMTVEVKSNSINPTNLIDEFSNELERLLVKQSSVEVFFEWLDSLLERELNQVSEETDDKKLDLCKDFLSIWMFFMNAINEKMLKDEKSDPHFSASFKPLQLLLNEYVNFLVEQVRSDLTENQYRRMLLNCSSSDQNMLAVINMPSPTSAAKTPPATPTPFHSATPTPFHSATPTPYHPDTPTTFHSAPPTSPQSISSRNSNPLQQQPCFKSSLASTAVTQSDPALTTAHAYSEHQILNQLESCVALDYQNHTLPANVVPNIVGVDQMNSLPATLPPPTDVNSLAVCYDTFPPTPSSYFSSSSPLSTTGSSNSCLASPVFPHSCYLGNSSTASCFIGSSTSPSLSASSNSSCVSSPEFPNAPFDFGVAPHTPMSSNSLYPPPFTPSGTVFNFESAFDCFGNDSSDFAQCGTNSGSVSSAIEPSVQLPSFMTTCAASAGDGIHFNCTPFDAFDDVGGDPLSESFFNSMMQDTLNTFSLQPSVISQKL